MRGHVRKRGRKWAIVLDAGRDADGKRRQKWHSGFGTKQEAEDALVELLGKRLRGEVIDPDMTPLGEYLTKWVDGRVGELAPLSITQYGASSKTTSPQRRSRRCRSARSAVRMSRRSSRPSA